MDLQSMKTFVVGRVGRKAYASMLRHISAHTPVLWGLEQEKDFVEATMCYTLYMDLKRCGIVAFINKVGSSLGFKLTPRSVLHNVNKIRQVLANWADERLMLGDHDDWDRAAVRVKRPKALKVGGKCRTTRNFAC
jgi:hypothetical protein